MKIRSFSLFTVLLLLLASSLSACGGGAETLTLAPLGSLPESVQNAPPTVQEAYRFAAANPEVLENYPCYCGCVNMGHASNRDCYIKNIQADGTIEFDNHANGCTLCVDITQDVMRLMRDGKDVATIRDYVDSTYSPFGPGTDTPAVGSAIESCSQDVSACGDGSSSAPALNLNELSPSNVPTTTK